MKILKITLLFFSLSILLLVLLETGLRISDYGYGTAYVLRQRTPAGEKAVLNPCALLPYAGLSVVNSSKEGFLNLPIDKPADNIRVLVLGGSAAYGAYSVPDLGFARYLEAMLSLQFRDHSINVVNLAFPSLNTASMRRILQGAFFLNPDAVVCYEAANDLGRGVVMQQGPLPPAIMPFVEETMYTLKRMKTYQLAVAYAGRFIRRLPESLLNQDVYNEFNSFRSLTPDVMRALGSVYRHNLKKMAALCRKKNVPVFFCTYGYNQKNLCSADPFTNNTDLEEITANMVLLRRAYVSERAGDYVTAVSYYERFLNYFPQFADPLGHLAFCYQALGRPDKAAALYSRARSLSAGYSTGLDSLNRLVREIATAAPDDGVFLVDVADALKNESPLGYLADETFFTDIVHLTAEGSYRTASEIDRCLVRYFDRDTVRPRPSQAACEQWMGVTGSFKEELMASNRKKNFAALTALLGRPPLSYALMHDVTKWYRLKMLAQGAEPVDRPGGGAFTGDRSLGAGGDYYYQKNRMAGLSAAGKGDAALSVARHLVEATDRHSLSLILYGQALLRQEQPSPALNRFTEALALPARGLDLGLRMEAARAALSCGRPREAVDILEKGRRILENNAPVIDFNQRTLAGFERQYLSMLENVRQQLSGSGQKNEHHQK